MRNIINSNVSPEINIDRMSQKSVDFARHRHSSKMCTNGRDIFTTLRLGMMMQSHNKNGRFRSCLQFGLNYFVAMLVWINPKPMWPGCLFVNV